MKRWWPLLAGIMLTPMVLFLGVLSGGSGHGDYILARVLLPWASGLTMVANEARWHGPAVVLAAAAQCPLYGALIAWRRRALWPLLAIHFALVLGLFLRPG